MVGEMSYVIASFGGMQMKIGIFKSSTEKLFGLG